MGPNQERVMELHAEIAELQKELKEIQPLAIAEARAMREQGTTPRVTDGENRLLLTGAGKRITWAEADLLASEPDIAERVRRSRFDADSFLKLCEQRGYDRQEVERRATVTVVEEVFDEDLLRPVCDELGVPFDELADESADVWYDWTTPAIKAAAADADRSYEQIKERYGQQDERLDFGPATEDDVRQWLWAQMGTGDRRPCPSCGEHLRLCDLHLDHVHPASRGGSDDAHNRQLLCQRCNLVKGDQA